MSNNVIGMDIGATNIHIGTVCGGEVIRDLQIPTSSNAPKDQIIREIIDGIETLAGDDFTSIGVGVPGLVNVEKGIVYDLWNIPSWKEVFLKDHLEEYFKRPVKIVNDANAFALGENKYGEGRRYKNFVGVSLGTGYGTGIIINNQLYSGMLSGAGELASISYLDKTIEDYCSSKFFKSHYEEEGKQLFRKAKKGDPQALRAFNEFGEHLGESLKFILYTLAPEAIILGGSISKSYDFFKDALMSAIDTFPFNRISDNVEIIPSKMPNVSILGPAALFEEERALS